MRFYIIFIKKLQNKKLAIEWAHQENISLPFCTTETCKPAEMETKRVTIFQTRKKTHANKREKKKQITNNTNNQTVSELKIKLKERKNTPKKFHVQSANKGRNLLPVHKINKCLCFHNQQLFWIIMYFNWRLLLVLLVLFVLFCFRWCVWLACRFLLLLFFSSTFYNSVFALKTMRYIIDFLYAYTLFNLLFIYFLCFSIVSLAVHSSSSFFLLVVVVIAFSLFFTLILALVVMTWNVRT